MPHDPSPQETPGAELNSEKMPGHWLLARLGKRVLRPGGLELTRQMLDQLSIGPGDRVVEFAPGLGTTARLTIERKPAAYTAVERDEDAAAVVRRYMTAPTQRCVVASADRTGLPDASADVVYGEAMLSMQTPAHKQAILHEAHRLLALGGRYGMHEMCLVPDDIDAEKARRIQGELTAAIHHGVRPLTVREWRDALASEGFVVRTERRSPMRLLEPGRIVRDEGLKGALRFFWRLLWDKSARGRVRRMRSVFQKYQANLSAILLVAVKEE